MNNSSLWQDAIRRLIQNRAAMIGGITILILIILAVFAPWIAPYSYSYQNLDIGASPPSAEHLLGTDVLGRDLLSRLLYGARISLLVGRFRELIAYSEPSYNYSTIWLLFLIIAFLFYHSIREKESNT